jgi:hypothetical protein
MVSCTELLGWKYKTLVSVSDKDRKIERYNFKIIVFSKSDVSAILCFALVNPVNIHGRNLQS